MRSLFLLLALALAIPAIGDARGFGGGFHGGGGFHSSFGGGFHSSGGFGSRPSFGPPGRSYSSGGSFGGNYRTAAPQAYSVNRTYVTHNYVNRGYGGGGFFTGWMMGSMMSQPYCGGYPPAYMGGMGYGMVGGYGLSGYYDGRGYYPYSTAGMIFADFLCLLMVFLIVWFIAAVALAVARSDIFDDDF